MGNVSPLVVEKRLQALADLHHTAEKLADGCYLVQGLAIYYPALDFWKLRDHSMQGYGQRSMIDAIDVAQLRGMIPEPAAAPAKAAPVITGRDSVQVPSDSILTNRSLDSQPLHAESVVTGSLIPPDATVVVIDPLSEHLEKLAEPEPTKTPLPPSVDWS